eukprot:jgi/Picsp_1/725/NSC_04214-R1_alpha beta hydrolase fold protein
MRNCSKIGYAGQLVRNAPYTNHRYSKKISKCNASKSDNPASTKNAEFELIRSIANQASKETLPWVMDLVMPLLGVEEVEMNMQNGSTIAERVDHEGLGTCKPEDLGDVDSKFASVFGVKMHYKEEWPEGVRDTNVPCIVLVHGFNASLFSWRATMKELAAETGARVIAFDRPPFGLSGRPLEWGNPGNPLTFNPYEIEGSAKMADELLRVLEVGDMVVIGHSAGALLALKLYEVVASKDRVVGLGFVAPAVPSTPDNSFQRRATFGSQIRIVLSQVILRMDGTYVDDGGPGLRYVRRNILNQRKRILEAGLGYVPHYATSSSYSSSFSMDEGDDRVDLLDGADLNGVLWDGDVHQEAVDGYLRPLKAKDWDKAALLNLRAFSIPMEYDYSGINIPVLVILGREDESLWDNGLALVRLLRERQDGSVGTVFHEMSCGHVPMEEMPIEFNELVKDFFMRYFVSR